ncbi:MAG: molybdate ABC transporter permease subunit [Epsilonproteobacteria bacterium]|nr:molybdate ABC transporter permease subunit [Campylobacterota bacterium]NPA64064.1 molybdate ABC transporter permease subunit [Campylobacterota bacterium]
MIDWTPFWLSFKLAGVTTVILLLIGIPLAWWLSRTKTAIKPILETIVALPIVLPPTVIGFYILWALAPDSYLGSILHELFGIKLVFSFWGIVVGSVIYSLPFMVQPLQSGFESVPKSLYEASFIAGKGELETLVRVILPNIKGALATAVIITFAHTLGEFGVVLMVGGSIPGETKVASIAIYELVESLDFRRAHIYSLVMVAISFAILLAVYSIKRRDDAKS